MRRHKIDILALSESYDADGFPTKTWNPITQNKIWADVKDQGSKEFYASNSENREHIIRCNISYRNDISDNMRILLDGNQYDIIRIYNGDYRMDGQDIDGVLIEGAVD